MSSLAQVILTIHSLGAPFSISYTVSQRPLDPCEYLFFKLFMNGRAITSWGIDLDDRSTGRVAQSLWKPSEQWDSLAGAEARTFEFLAVQEDKPLAEEGGMIEIQVFRAKARRQRALRLEAVRGGEMYGIGYVMAPSTIHVVDLPTDDKLEFPVPACLKDRRRSSITTGTSWTRRSLLTPPFVSITARGRTSWTSNLSPAVRGYSLRLSLRTQRCRLPLTLLPHLPLPFRRPHRPARASASPTISAATLTQRITFRNHSRHSHTMKARIL